MKSFALMLLFMPARHSCQVYVQEKFFRPFEFVNLLIFLLNDMRGRRETGRVSFRGSLKN